MIEDSAAPMSMWVISDVIDAAYDLFHCLAELIELLTFIDAGLSLLSQSLMLVVPKNLLEHLSMINIWVRMLQKKNMDCLQVVQKYGMLQFLL